jgi:hypothetical protein
VLPIQGSSTTSYLYLGDRWAGAWSGPVNDSEYVWLPLTFSSNTSLSMAWYPQVSIDTTTGAVAGVGSGNAYYRLAARHSGKCLDVSSSSTADSANVLQWTCNGGANQSWQIRDLGTGYVQLVARHSHKCLDVTGSSTADGARAQQYTCGSGTNQQWQFQDLGTGYFRVVARHSGKCLDVSSFSTADGANILQWTCGTGTNQQWARS